MIKKYAVVALVVLVIVLSACGNNSSQPSQVPSASQITQVPVSPQRKAASASDFKAALKSVGYLEESEFDNYFSSVINTEGYNSISLYNSARENGIVGYMYSDDDIGDIPGMRQYLYYELNDLLLENNEVSYLWGNIITYIVFTDESSAISAINDIKNELEVSTTEINEDHYSRITAQDAGELIVIGRVDNTCVIFMGSADCPARQVFDILGY